MISRLAAKWTAPKARYQEGSISTRQEEEAAKAVAGMEQKIAQISQDLMTMDGSSKDLNREVAQDVYTLNPSPKNFIGHAVQSPQGQPLQLRAEGWRERATLTIQGDRKEISLLSWGDGPGPDQLFTEQLATFKGGEVTYQTFEYWDRPRSPYFKD